MRSTAATFAPVGCHQYTLYHHRNTRLLGTTFAVNPSVVTGDTSMMPWREQYVYKQHPNVTMTSPQVGMTPASNVIEVKEEKALSYEADLVPNRVSIKVTHIESVFVELTNNVCFELLPELSTRLLVRGGAGVSYNYSSKTAALHHQSVQVLHTQTNTCARFLKDSLTIDVDNVGGGITVTGIRLSWTLDSQTITPISENNFVGILNCAKDISRLVFLDSKVHQQLMDDKCIDIAKRVTFMDLTPHCTDNEHVQLDKVSRQSWYHVFLDDSRYRLRHEATSGETSVMFDNTQLCINPSTKGARMAVASFDAEVKSVKENGRVTPYVTIRVRPARSPAVKIVCNGQLVSINFEGHQGGYTFADDGRLCHNQASSNRVVTSQQ